MIVAWYTTPFWRHLPWSGHDVLFVQLRRYYLCCFTFFIAEDCLIVAGDDLEDVIHTAIAQFHCIFIDDFVEFVFWWEAHTKEAEEFLSYVGGNVFPIWRVEPSDFSSSSFFFAGFFYFIMYVLEWAHVFLGALSGYFVSSILYIFMFAVHQHLFISGLFQALVVWF